MLRPSGAYCADDVVVEVLGDAGGLVVVLQIDGDQFGDFHLVLQVLFAEEVDAVDDGGVVLGGITRQPVAKCAAVAIGAGVGFGLGAGGGAVPIEPVAPGTLQIEVRLAVEFGDGDGGGHEQRLAVGPPDGCRGAVLQFRDGLRLAGTAQRQKPDLRTGTRAGGIHTDEGQGAIVGTDGGRGIAAVAEGQLLGLGVGIVEVDAPQVGTVFVGGLAFGIGGRVGVDGLDAVDRERSVGRHGDAGDIANLEDVGAGDRLLAARRWRAGADPEQQEISA